MTYIWDRKMTYIYSATVMPLYGPLQLVRPDHPRCCTWPGGPPMALRMVRSDHVRRHNRSGRTNTAPWMVSLSCNVVLDYSQRRMFIPTCLPRFAKQ